MITYLIIAKESGPTPFKSEHGKARGGKTQQVKTVPSHVEDSKASTATQQSEAKGDERKAKQNNAKSRKSMLTPEQQQRIEENKRKAMMKLKLNLKHF